MEHPQGQAPQRRRSLSERVSDLMHRVTHPHHEHHDREHGNTTTATSGGESHAHPQHAKQQVQPTHHQYGGPDNEHDLAYEAEANLAGAHAIPPFGFNWFGKKSHPDPSHQHNQAKATELHPATTAAAGQMMTGNPNDAEASTGQTSSVFATPAPATKLAPAPPAPMHPFDTTPAPAGNHAQEGQGDHHFQEQPAGLNQLQV